LAIFLGFSGQGGQAKIGVVVAVDLAHGRALATAEGRRGFAERFEIEAL
jgi:hypothetical protein